jgi:arylsulfatase A-like enzyme
MNKTMQTKSTNFRAGIILLSLVAIASGFSSNAQSTKPNIIYILTDQQSANAMSNAGSAELNTPAMDVLAKDGISFTKAYCTLPLCSPSRASMMTGLMPHETGNNANGVALPDSIKPHTLPFFLKEHGYQTYYGGKWHLASYSISEGQGFDEFTNFGDDDLADSAIAYIGKRHDKPFFMMLSLELAMINIPTEFWLATPPV